MEQTHKLERISSTAAVKYFRLHVCMYLYRFDATAFTIIHNTIYDIMAS